MKPLNCLTLFLRTGKKFKLESGEAADDLARDHQMVEQVALPDAGQDETTVRKASDKEGLVNKAIYFAEVTRN